MSNIAIDLYGIILPEYALNNYAPNKFKLIISTTKNAIVHKS